MSSHKSELQFSIKHSNKSGPSYCILGSVYAFIFITRLLSQHGHQCYGSLDQSLAFGTAASKILHSKGEAVWGILRVVPQRVPFPVSFQVCCGLISGSGFFNCFSPCHAASRLLITFYSVGFCSKTISLNFPSF